MEFQVFSAKNYKLIMKRKLLGAENRGQISRAAEYLNCQRSYLSRVISDEPHLSPDHALQLSLFWKLKPDERDYFLTLVEHERAATPELRAYTLSKILELKKKHESIGNRTERKSEGFEAERVTYFSSWEWSAIHFMTSIPELQTAKKISEKLGLKESEVLKKLKVLVEREFVEEVRDRFIYKGGEFHAPKNSPLVLLHHQNWRARAVLDAQDFGNDGLHYTNIQTMSREDAEKLKTLLLDFISESNRIAGPSKPEEAIAITCDLFRL